MRPTIDQYYLNMARLVSTRATCLRRSVGCVLVNADRQVLSTGYNGVGKGEPHCNESVIMVPAGVAVNDKAELRRMYPNACASAFAASGTLLDGCNAIHAEQNALLQCKDVRDIHVCYVTTAPCATCTKLLMNTTCKRICFSEGYPHLETVRELWIKAGRSLEQIATA